jgi:hypothetical protein
MESAVTARRNCHAVPRLASRFLQSSGCARSETRQIHAEFARLTSIVRLARGVRSDDV